MKIKTTELLKRTGWNYVPEMSLYENENLTLPNGSTAVISINMLKIFDGFLDEEKAFLEKSLLVAHTILFKNYWWHREMFEVIGSNICLHDWVNVSFNHVTLACKHCGSNYEQSI